MSTNMNELAFTESGNTVNVKFVSGTPSNIEAEELELQDHGVMMAIVDGGTRTLTFVPYENVSSIVQTEAV